MHLKDLEYFAAVAKEKSFTKAAQILFVSQPSLTVSINRLEEELGKRLLMRQRGEKNVQLTNEGEIVLSHAKKVLREIDLIYDETKIENKKIRLGLPPIIGAYLFPSISKHIDPDIMKQIELVETGSADMKKLLNEDKVDLCFIGTESPLSDENLEKYFIMQDTYCIFVPKEHPLAQRKRLSFRELKGQQFVSLGKGYVQYQILKDLCFKNQMKSEIDNLIISNEIQTLKSLITSRVAIGFMVKSSLETRKDIQAIPLKESIHFYIYLVRKKDRELSKFENEVKESLIKSISKIDL